MKRDTYIDNIKGFLIVLVVLGHIIECMTANFDIARQLYMFIYIFHMPTFTFLSGYFSTDEKGNLVAKKLFSRFLLPYMIFQVLFLLIKFSYHSLTTKEMVLAILTPQYALWYIFCLFFWRSILPYFMKLSNPIRLSVVIGLLVGFLPQYTFVFSSSRMLAFFPFFVAGYNARKNKWLPSQLINSHSSKYKVISIFILLCALTCSVIFNGRFQDQFLYALSYFATERSIWRSLLFRLIAYSTSFLVGLSFMLIVPTSHNIISQIGKRSLYVYLLHSLLLYVFVCSQSLSAITRLYGFVGTTLLGVPLSILLSMNKVQRLTKVFVEPHTIWN